MYKLPLLIVSTFLIALGARLSISIPGVGVPQTAQTMIVLGVVGLLPANVGWASVALYLVLGALGFPVFADGAGGIEHLLGKSGGFLFGFLLAAYYLEKIATYIQENEIWKVFACSYAVAIKAHGIILLCGWLWLGKKIGYSPAFEYGVQPFLIGALLKSLPVALALVYLRKNRLWWQKFG